jgi:MFS family permease
VAFSPAITDDAETPVSPIDSLPADPARGTGWTPRLVISLFSMLCLVEAVAFAYVGTTTALPSIIAEFQTTQAGWLLTAFALVGSVSAPLLGKLADLYGKRRIMLVSIGIAVLGDLLAALAPQFWVMVVGQALHGCISACIFLGYSLMRDVYPPRLVPFTASVSITGSGVLTVFAPFVIGALIDNYGFRSLYVFDLVFILVMAAVIVATTPETPVRRAARLDVLGAVLLAAGLSTVLLAVSEGSSWGWLSAPVLGLLAIGTVLLVVYVVTALRRTDPILDLRVLARRAALIGVVTGGVAYGLNPMTQTLMALLARTPREVGGDYGLGLTASQYAWISAPLSVGSVLSGICVGLVVRRTGARMTMFVGLGLMGVGSLLVLVGHDALWQMIVASVVTGIGLGLALGSMPNLIMAGTPAHEQGSIASVGQLAAGFVGAVTPIIAFAILAPGAKSPAPGVLVYSGSAIGVALVVAAALAAVTILVGAVFLRPRPADRPVAAPIPAEDAAPA